VLKQTSKCDDDQPRITVVSIKEVAHRLGLEPRFLRQLLRFLYPDRPRARWIWHEPEAERVIKHVRKALSPVRGRS
jgi:hypothetical protein